jgi:hypothetical protein
MRSKVLGLGLVVPLALLAACNEVTTGEYGALTFTPDSCGDNGCSLDDRLIAGASVNVTLDDATRPHENVDLSDLTLISDDPTVARVEVVERSGLTSEWKVIGVNPGYAHLIAIDLGGYEIDRTDIQVGRIDRFQVRNAAATSVRTADRAGFDQVWTVRAGAVADLTVEPFDDGIMGRFKFHVDIDRVMFATMSPAQAKDLENGHMVFNVAAGEYTVTFTASDGSTFDLLVIAQ